MQKTESSLRANLTITHENTWSRLGGVDCWIDAKTRIAMVAEPRHANECSLCKQVKTALRLASISFTPTNDEVSLDIEHADS